MAQLPEAFGTCVTVDTLAAARRVCSGLYPHAHVSEGVFAGSTPSAACGMGRHW
jgi:hypothetical protein